MEYFKTLLKTFIIISSIKKNTLWYIDYHCFYCLLAERDYSLRTPEVKDRSVDENIHIMQSTSRISLFSEIYTKHPFFSRGTPLQKSELYTNYLLAGVGAVIFMVLFMIVIEIRRKSKPPKRKPLLLTRTHENQTCDETFKRLSNGSSKTNLNIVSSKQSNFFSQYMDPVYYEIDESVEVMQIQASTDIPTASGDRNLPKCINNASRNVQRSDDSNAQSSESHI